MEPIRCFNQAAIVFPFIVGAPRYFAGAISLGQLIQISNAFGQVQNALTYFVDAYTQLTDWAAVVKRLTRGEGDSYAEYVERVAEDPLARQIKMADLNDNYRLDRVILRDGEKRETDLRRIERYILSHQYLAGLIQLPEYRQRMAMIGSSQEGH
jgi:ABC-type uncharacterized transport system fused permease/ATPase subunit